MRSGEYNFAMFLPNLEPLPTAAQYDRAFGEFQAELALDGGIKFHLARRALFVSLDLELQEQDRRLAAYGMRFIDESLDPDDGATYTPCEAFMNGYRVMSDVLDQAYTTEHSFEDRLSSLDQWFLSGQYSLD